jgi:hypothetical protein
MFRFRESTHEMVAAPGGGDGCGAGKGCGEGRRRRHGDAGMAVSEAGTAAVRGARDDGGTGRRCSRPVARWWQHGEAGTAAAQGWGEGASAPARGRGDGGIVRLRREAWAQGRFREAGSSAGSEAHGRGIGAEGRVGEGGA